MKPTFALIIACGLAACAHPAVQPHVATFPIYHVGSSKAHHATGKRTCHHVRGPYCFLFRITDKPLDFAERTLVRWHWWAGDHDADDKRQTFRGRHHD